MSAQTISIEISQPKIAVQVGQTIAVRLHGQGPRGLTGETGPAGPSGPSGPSGPQPPLSSATPQPLGVAAAGSGTEASRDDHVHLLPTLATLGAAARQPAETALGTLGATQAIAWADTVYTATVGEDVELTLGDNWPAAGKSAAVDLVLDNSGGYAITWTLVDYWAGTAPSGAGVYLITIWSVAGTIYAAGVARGDGT